jgi:EAL domain-containing protein (putative c-di-GMP-specific phosphodiesterase class I)
MEILSRWNDPKFGTLVPDDYIPLLEEAGKISDLDLFVLEKAVENYKNRANTDIPVVPWMINLSGRDFDRIDFVDRFLGIAEGVDPYLIALDISAAALSDAKPHVRKALQRLTEAGFNLWMDDFGFGNSAIDILSSYQISGIKVDIRSLQEVARGSSQSIMLSHIVSMCKDLSVSTLALGVETEEEMNFLCEIGFEYVQGYYLSGKDSYEQYTARKDGTVYEIEPLQSRDYYTKISRVNLSRPTQVGKNSRIENLAADIPAAICEMRGSTISCIRTNKAFRQFLQAAGFSDVSAYENRLNDESARLCSDSREVFRKLRDSDVWMTEKFAYDRLSLVASFHKISVDPIDDAVCVIGVVLDLSTYQKFSA